MAQHDQDDASGGSAARRVDQWLWFARVMKSRTLAAQLVATGKVRVNRDRIDKPSYGLKVGDVVTVTAHARVRVLKVAALGQRRGPPSEAATLFTDLTPPAAPQAETKASAPPAARDPGAGRPTKRDRRVLDKLKRGEGDE
jgi:ribosome-associated heat shock protein Hsp15